MKVKNLIERLNSFDPDHEVFCYCEEDEAIFDKNNGDIILSIENVDEVTAEKTRLQDNTPKLKFEKNENSSQFVLITVTADF